VCLAFGIGNGIGFALALLLLAQLANTRCDLYNASVVHNDRVAVVVVIVGTIVIDQNTGADA
jgi:hypothetical protein